METLGWLKKVAAKIAAYFNVLVDVILAFLNIHKYAAGKEKVLKIGSAGIRSSLYYAADWLIFWLFISVAALLKYCSAAGIVIFLALWVLEMLVSLSVLLLWRKVKWDITLGEAYRNAFNVLHEASGVVSILALVLLMVKFLLWDGTDRLVVFWDKELDNFSKKAAVLALASCIKMVVWTKVILLGYETIGELMKSL